MPPKTKKSKQLTKPTVALVKAVVKKVNDAALEDKYVTQFIQTSGYPRYLNAEILGTSADLFPLMPQILQGVDSNNRVGDRIRPKKMRVDFTMSCNGEINSSWLLQTRLMVLQDKSIKDTNALLPNPGVQPGTPVGTDLLNVGGGLSGFTGAPGGIMTRINRERYTVIKDIHKELINGAGLGPILPNSWGGVQSFVSGAQCHKFSVVIPTPAVLKYAKATDSFPTNFAPFFVLGYAQPDGNAASSSIQSRVAINYVVHFDYEDA